MTDASKNRTSQGKGIRCTSCGGTFPLATLAAGAVCPYCGTQQSMTATAVVEARQYRAEVSSEMRGAKAEHGRAAAWEEGSRASGVSLVFMGAMMVVPALLGIPALILHLVDVPTELEAAADALASICTLVTIFGAMGGFALWRLRRPHVKRTPSAPEGPASKVACPHCGAPNHLKPGQHVQTCGHCRGALMPGRTVMVAGLDAARSARRRAVLERYRTERSGMHTTRRNANRYFMAIPLIVIVSMVPTCAISLGGGRSAADFTLSGVLVAVSALLFALAIATGVAGFIYLRWRGRRRSWRSALVGLAYQFRGHSSTEVGELVSWLNQAWAGPYDLNFIGGGPRFGAVLLDAWGFAAAVALNPLKSSINPYETTPTYARIMLAAWVPSRTDGGPAPTPDGKARETMAWLESAGFAVSCEEAGILATAQARVLNQLRNDPEAVRRLAPVIGHLARFAQEIGAKPVRAGTTAPE